MKLQLNANCLLPVDSFALSGVEVRCVFKSHSPFQGVIEDFKAWAKEQQKPERQGAKPRPLAFAKGGTTANGRQAGLFPLFLPTNQRQRDWMAGNIGEPVEVGVAYRFFRGEQANDLYKALQAAGIPVSKDSNFLWGLQQETPQAAPQEEESEAVL